jgi:type IV pilus assembly protein PilQ
MTRVWKGAALAAVLLLATVSSRASAAAIRHEQPANTITSLRVVPGSGRADVVIAIDGNIDLVDFTLDAGKRIVVDMKGATLGVPARLYDKVSRGGITNIRVAQNKIDVVRIVLELDSPREYTVVRGEHDIKISVNGPDTFGAWSLGKGATATVGAMSVNGESMPPTASPAPQAPAPQAPAPQQSSAPARSAVSDRQPQTPAMQAAPRGPEQKRITVSFQDVHIRDVIGAFAKFSDRTIIIGKAVDGFVTADIVDQPWDVALRQILQSQGFTALEDSNGIITVDSYTNLADREKVEPLITRVIAVNYAKADAMAKTVKDLLSAGCGGGAANAAASAANAGAQSTCSTRGAVTFDEKTNTVIITETATRLEDIASYVRDLDVRTPQVSIKAKIVAVDRTGTEQLGLAYDLGSANTFSNALVTRFQDAAGVTPVAGDYRVNLTGDGIAAVGNASRPYKGGALALIYQMTLGGFNLTSFLDALSSEQLTDVQAEPSTTTVDNKEAELFAGSQLAFLLTPPVIAGQIQSVAPQIQRQDIGITLRVTPHVTANRQILMNVFAEQQTLVSVTTAGPSTNKRNSKNEVLVGDGETAVIGGLTQTQVTRNRTGIPILMNLPGIGRLFSQTELIERKQDLLILITPHIIDDGEVVRSQPSGPNKKP